MNIQKISTTDLYQIQECNLLNLPENYTMKYYLYHLITWPNISFVAKVDSQIVAYVLCKMENEGSPDVHGHVTSLSVLRPFRRLGIAQKLMAQAERAIALYYPTATHITLHVRSGNAPAISLYKNILNFTSRSIDKNYYADGEDAVEMQKKIQTK